MEVISLFFNSRIANELYLSLVKKSMEDILTPSNDRISNCLKFFEFNVSKRLGNETFISIFSVVSSKFFRSSSDLISIGFSNSISS
jgi:hypothetical protein